MRDILIGSLADVVGMVTQESYLFHATIRRNLLYARPDATREEVERAATAALIHDRIMEFPDGYDTVVGRVWLPAVGWRRSSASRSRA